MSRGRGRLVEAHIKERSSAEGRRGEGREEKKETLTPSLEKQLVH